MPSLQRFTPHYHSGQTVTAGASQQLTIVPNSLSVCITNTGATNTAYVRVGTGTITADATDYPILPLHQQIITKAFGHDQIAIYAAAGTTIHVMDGEGF